MVVVEEVGGGGCIVRSDVAKLELTAEEASLYRLLFQLADVDDDGVVSRAEAKALLRRGLEGENFVDRVWHLSKGYEDGLDLGSFFVACKLVGLAQALDTADESAVTLSKLSDDPSVVSTKIANFSMTTTQQSVQRLQKGGGEDDPLVVKVLSPQLKGEGMAQHTVYAVRTRTNAPYFSRKDFRVERRFSDFAWCHDRLRRGSPGVVLPPLLSPKRWTNNTHHDFVRDRMESLTRFANRIAAHPRLRRSLEFMALLDASPQALQAVKRLDEALGVDPAVLAQAALRASSSQQDMLLDRRLLSPTAQNSDADEFAREGGANGGSCFGPSSTSIVEPNGGSSSVESLLSLATKTTTHSRGGGGGSPQPKLSAAPPGRSPQAATSTRASAWMSFFGESSRKLGSVVTRAARVATRDISELWLATTPDDVLFLSGSAYGGLAEASASTSFGHKLARLSPVMDRALVATEALVKQKRNVAYEASRTGHYLSVSAAGSPPDMLSVEGSTTDALLARLGETLESIASSCQDHIDHEVADFVEQVRYQRALNAAGLEACRDRRKAAEATRRADDKAERAIQEHASARSALDSRSSRVHVANDRRLAAIASRNASVEDEKKVERTLSAEADMIDGAKFKLFHAALVERARAHLAFARASRLKWQKLLNEVAQPTDDELTETRRRLSNKGPPIVVDVDHSVEESRDSLASSRKARSSRSASTGKSGHEKTNSHREDDGEDDEAEPTTDYSTVF